MTNKHQRRPDAGFTLMEMLVTLLVLAIVIILTLTLFDTNTRLAQVQTSVSDLQQNVRVGQQVIVKDIRTAGRGALGMQTFPVGDAVQVINNVAANTFIDPGNTIRVLEGTDILIVRGTISTPVYMISNSDSLIHNPVDGRGSIIAANTSRIGFAIPQSLTPLTDAITAARVEELQLVGYGDDANNLKVRLDPANCVDNSGDPTAPHVIVGFIGPTGAWPSPLQTIVQLSIVEEYRYYIADERAVAGDANSSRRPKLMRARVAPGSAPLTPWNGDANNWTLEVADNIFDLQVALGIDQDGDGVLTDLQNNADEWLFNDPTDVVGPAGNWDGFPLFNVRINTLALAERPDQRYEAVDFIGIEDHAYTLAANDLLNGLGRRQYRRRVLQTGVDLRNLF